MKRIIYYWAALFLVCVCCASCSEDELEGSQILSVSSFYPTLVMDGTEVTVTGTAMESVKEIIFPGGVNSSQITQIDNRTLKVVAPAGVSTEADVLILKSENGEVASRQTMRKAQPVFLSYQYAENDGAMTGSGMTINGKDLLLVEDVVFTLEDNGTRVNALEMIRKSNASIKLTVPQDTPIGEAVQVTLNFKNGETMSLPEIEVLKGAGGGSWVEQEVPVYSGEPIDVGAWSGYAQIPASAFADAKVDDLLRVYISDCGANPQGSLKNGSSWSGLVPELEYFDISGQAEIGYYEYLVTEEILAQLQESGLIVGGQNYIIQKVSLFTSVWIEGGDTDARDPITDSTIMLNSFEDTGDHNSSWDGSWTSGVELEFPQEANGNTYLRLKTTVDGDIWLVNCNHQDIGTVSGIENYVIKFDLLIENGITGASEAAMQFVLGDKWLWVGAGMFPETTDGKWMTISRNISDLNADLTGDLAIGKNTNGLYGTNIPQGICIDNLRLDPK